MVTAEADYDGQTRSADMFVLPASAAGDIPAPSDDVLKAYFNDRKSSYRAPEYRAVDVVALDPETLANPAEVSDADAEAAYAKLAGKDPKFGAPEKRDLEQILFPNQADADAAAAKIKDGASFDDIVKARNLKPEDVELGPTAKDGVIDPTEADAVFALPAGGVSGVLPSQFGPVIVRVKSITPSTVKPFSEVAEDIKRRISAGRAGDKIQALHDKIEDLRVSGKPLAEAAKAEGLTTLSVPAVDAQGKDPSGKDVALPDAADLLRSVFASDVGLDEAPIATKDGGFVWFAVNKVEPSHERSFDEAKPQVEAQWRAEQVDKAARGQGCRSRQAIARRRERGRRSEERRRDGPFRPRHPSRRQGSARTGGRRDLPRAGRRGRIGRDARRPDGVQDHFGQDAARRGDRPAGQADRAAARSGEPRKPDRPVCRRAASIARRDCQPDRSAIR